MKHYTVTIRLSDALSDAVAVEWTNQPTPLDSGQGWEPCLRLPDGAWRFSSYDLSGLNPPHRRSPGLFGDLAIRYRLSAAGPWSAASESRKEIVILDVSDNPAPPPAAPLLLAAPLLAGTGMIGAEVTVAPGSWGGAPAPQLALQWRRNGTPIPGALGRTYVPGPADDMTDLDCQVTARNTLGEAAAVTPALRVTYPAPATVEELPEEIFDQAPGAELVETEFAFAGANLTFAAAGAAIDPRTGVLTVSTERAASGQDITVTATNSGGAASASLRVTVEAVTPEPLDAEDVSILRSVWRPLGQSVTFTPVVAFPGLAGETVDAIQWTAAPQFDADSNWHPCAARSGEAGAFELFAAGHPLPAGEFDPALFSTTTEANAARLSRLRFRWRVAAGEPWSEESEPYTVPLPTSGSLTPTVSRSSIDFGGGAVVTFNKAVLCGQYNNDDWFVVNPSGGFQITSWTPASTRRGGVSGTARNGAMRNPQTKTQGFDSLEFGKFSGGDNSTTYGPYDAALNVDPGKTGDPIPFAAGVEGTIVKAISLESPTNLSSDNTIYARMIPLTVVTAIPKAASFRPSMHGSVTSKASVGAMSDLRLDLLPRAAIDMSGVPSGHTLANVLQRFKGPWPTWYFSDRDLRQMWNVAGTLNVMNVLYGPNVATAFAAAAGYIVDNGTTETNRRELVKRLVQIGIDYAQPSRAVSSAADNFWPEAFAPMMLLADQLLPNAGLNVTGPTGKLGTMLPGNDPWTVNTTSGAPAGAQWRFVNQALIDAIPPQGMKPSDWNPAAEDAWPMLTPFLPEHMGPQYGAGGGEPWGKFSGERSGVSADINAEYRMNHSQSTFTLFLAGALGGGEAALNIPALIGYCDRLRRIRGGAFDGALPHTRDANNTGKGWQEWHLNIFDAVRSAYTTPVYVGPPEQPDPPVLTKNSASSLTITMTRYQPNGGSPITQRQYRIRTRSANSQAQVFEAWTGGWTNFNGSVTLTGLSAGWRQVQVRTQSALGSSPPSTNVAATGLNPSAYRAVVNMG